ncbi:MAG: chorismate mutase [Oscillospiraceae bacterium]|nr:chorismate mutase [Oscillospiraceae bacterium]
MNELDVQRKIIDEVDSELVALLEKRMTACEEIGRIKMNNGMKVLDAERERLILADRVSRAEKREYHRHIEEIFKCMMAESRRLQKSIARSYDSGKLSGRAAYQGVDGSFGSEAAASVFEDNIYNVRTFEDVFVEVVLGRADYGVLPVENYSTGSIIDVLDLLGKYEVYIVGETYVDVRQCLVGTPDAEIDDVAQVYSHEQGFYQSREYLADKDWIQNKVVNTAIAASMVSEMGDRSKAAICSARAAEIYGLKILKSNINFASNNRTRFIIIGRTPIIDKTNSKISIMFSAPHVSGSLCEALGFFRDNGVNMVKIESRPIAEQHGDYMFFVDLEGNVSSTNVNEALQKLQSYATNYRFLGNYRSLGQ